MRFKLRSATDVAALERHVAKLLACDPERCSFLRSTQYILVKRHALYGRKEDAPRPCFAQCGLCVRVSRRDGCIVVKEDRTPFVYDDSWTPSDDDSCE